MSLAQVLRLFFEHGGGGAEKNTCIRIGDVVNYITMWLEVVLKLGRSFADSCGASCASSRPARMADGCITLSLEDSAQIAESNDAASLNGGTKWPRDLNFRGKADRP